MKLSDYKDEEAFTVVANLLIPISNVIKDKQELFSSGKSVLEIISEMIKRNPADMMAISAILDGKEPSEYHCDGKKALSDAASMIADPALMELFGFRRRTLPSSGSASENAGGQKQ